MRREAVSVGVKSIAIPRIGVGYGGLSWKKVRAIVEKVFSDWEGMLFVHEKFEPENQPLANQVVTKCAFLSHPRLVLRAFPRL